MAWQDVKGQVEVNSSSISKGQVVAEGQKEKIIINRFVIILTKNIIIKKNTNISVRMVGGMNGL